jgi:hypothetical protein
MYPLTGGKRLQIEIVTFFKKGQFQPWTMGQLAIAVVAQPAHEREEKQRILVL